jgi:hypothetical protein
MVTELDIYRSAQLLIDQHGDDAGIEAAIKADTLFEQGDRAGGAVWMRIISAIDTLRLKEATGPTH